GRPRAVGEARLRGPGGVLRHSLGGRRAGPRTRDDGAHRGRSRGPALRCLSVVRGDAARRGSSYLSAADCRGVETANRRLASDVQHGPASTANLPAAYLGPAVRQEDGKPPDRRPTPPLPSPSSPFPSP